MKFAATSGQTAAIVSEVGNRVGWGLGGGRVRIWDPHEKVDHEMKTEMKIPLNSPLAVADPLRLAMVMTFFSSLGQLEGMDERERYWRPREARRI